MENTWYCHLENCTSETSDPKMDTRLTNVARSTDSQVKLDYPLRRDVSSLLVSRNTKVFRSSFITEITILIQHRSFQKRISIILRCKRRGIASLINCLFFKRNQNRISSFGPRYNNSHFQLCGSILVNVVNCSIYFNSQNSIIK